MKKDNKYENCTVVGVPVDKELHKELKVLCAQLDIHMKDLLHGLVEDIIKGELGHGKN